MSFHTREQGRAAFPHASHIKFIPPFQNLAWVFQKLGALAVSSECQRDVWEMLTVYSQASVCLCVYSPFPRYSQFCLSMLDTLNSLPKINLLTDLPLLIWFTRVISPTKSNAKCLVPKWCLFWEVLEALGGGTYLVQVDHLFLVPSWLPWRKSLFPVTCLHCHDIPFPCVDPSNHRRNQLNEEENNSFFLQVVYVKYDANEGPLPAWEGIHFLSPSSFWKHKPDTCTLLSTLTSRPIDDSAPNASKG